MSVELEPTELGFKRPFSQEVSQTLKLYNPHHQPVAFKVKTTAPKQYCVRPNSGKIDPNETVEVQVLLQAMKEDPPLDARCKDKFLVQSVAISASDDVSNVAAVWQQIEQTAKSSIQEKKIRVNFLPAGSAATNGASHEDAPPAYSTRNIEPVTPSKGGDVDKSFAESNETAQTPAQQSTVGTAVAAVTNSIPTSQEDLKRQLDAANAKISQLQQQAADGLRQRKTAVEGNEKISAAATTIQQNAPGGVSVAIVALLCFISFLLAYFLF